MDGRLLDEIELKTPNPIGWLDLQRLAGIWLGVSICVGVMLVTTLPARASCYGWRTGDRATINLQDKKSGYLRLWSNTKLDGQIVAKLKHGIQIRVIDFIEDPTCGGTVYLEARINNRRIRGWVNSDVLVGYSKE
jgi:hypothetical protein